MTSHGHLTIHEDVIVRAAVRNRCWILVEGGPNSAAAGHHLLSKRIKTIVTIVNVCFLKLPPFFIGNIIIYHFLFVWTMASISMSQFPYLCSISRGYILYFMCNGQITGLCTHCGTDDQNPYIYNIYYIYTVYTHTLIPCFDQHI